MTTPLAATLARVAAALRDAADPWWIIGSAAVRLHDVPTTTADVDVLTSARDAARLLRRWSGGVTMGGPSERFRSDPFARLHGAPLPIEVMGDLAVRVQDEWRAVRPRSRVVRGGVFVPDRAVLVDILRMFGRAKDDERAARLSADDPF